MGVDTKSVLKLSGEFLCQNAKHRPEFESFVLINNLINPLRKYYVLWDSDKTALIALLK